MPYITVSQETDHHERQETSPVIIIRDAAATAKITIRKLRGNISVVDADILHVGDTLWNGVYPFIDYSTGGSIDGAIRAAEANVARVTDKTIIIPGHGPLGDKAQLIEFRDMLLTIHNKVAAMKKRGKSLDEVIAAKPTADYDAKWGGFVINGSTFTSLVYAGVSGP